MAKLATPSARIDKSTWGPGPWQDEPDLVQWRYLGYDCLAVLNEMGHWCGYVGIPQNHPAYGGGGYELNVDVHGGITFSGSRAGFLKGAAALRNWYFLGFDCGHAGDRSIGIEATLRHYSGQLDEQFDRATSETYRTLHYVKQQVRSLARQLYRMETADAS